jgi:hypothetical protein
MNGSETVREAQSAELAEVSISVTTIFFDKHQQTPFFLAFLRLTQQEWSHARFARDIDCL